MNEDRSRRAHTYSKRTNNEESKILSNLIHVAPGKEKYYSKVEKELIYH
jgi:hypothetical protein